MAIRKFAEENEEQTVRIRVGAERSLTIGDVELGGQVVDVSLDVRTDRAPRLSLRIGDATTLDLELVVLDIEVTAIVERRSARVLKALAGPAESETPS